MLPRPPSPVSPFRAHVHTHARVRTHTYTYVRTYVRPGGGRHNQPRELSGTALAYSTRANSPPPFSLTLSLSLLLPFPLFPSPTPFDGYTPNLQLSPSHHHEHAIYYTPLPLPEGTAGCAAGSLWRVCSRIKLLRTIYRCHRYTVDGKEGGREAMVVECTYAFSFREIGCLMLSVV